MSLPYTTKPKTVTGRYMVITTAYAQITDRGNLDDFFMSVWTVGKMEAPPNEKSMVPNARENANTMFNGFDFSCNIIALKET